MKSFGVLSLTFLSLFLIIQVVSSSSSSSFENEPRIEMETLHISPEYEEEENFDDIFNSNGWQAGKKVAVSTPPASETSSSNTSPLFFFS
jgi:hypothetical protein